MEELKPREGKHHELRGRVRFFRQTRGFAVYLRVVQRGHDNKGAGCRRRFGEPGGTDFFACNKIIIKGGKGFGS